jgi:hypothetical protein
MRLFNRAFVRGQGCLCLVGWLMLVAVLAVGTVGAAHTDAAPPEGAPSEACLTAFLTRWFTEIQAGRTNRSLSARAYVAQITDAAVATMSRDLNKYGASPLRAEIVQTRKDGEQNFYIVKFIFPRGMRPACCSASTRTARSPASPSAAWPGTDSVITAMT